MMKAYIVVTLLTVLLFDTIEQLEGKHWNKYCWKRKDCVLYTNSYAIEIKGKPHVANELAKKHGFVNLGPIWSSSRYYEFLYPKAKVVSNRHNPRIKKILVQDKRVAWFEQQKVSFVEARYFEYYDDDNGIDCSDNSGVNLRENEPGPPERLNEKPVFNDPLYPSQWYLHQGAFDRYDMDVLKAWGKGYTGKGVVVTTLDDGVQADHPDLQHSYDPLASIDLLHGIYDHPIPHRIPFKHGTRCAGEITAQANNHICGVGVAFGARIGGVRLLDALITDAREARALSFNNDYIDVFSASWGPADNGRALGGPGQLSRKALKKGVTFGRRGLGSLYIWAAGNGGKFGDDCNADGYANSIYTITISSANKKGLKPWYVEECASIVAATYSSGVNGSRTSGIITTDLIMAPGVLTSSMPREKMCTTSAGGTSASAPIAAGITALVLEANPNLTWRDVKYIIVQTARHHPLRLESGWKVNAAKKVFSHKFGFGLMDAGAMIEKALNWVRVPPMISCKTKHVFNKRIIPRHQDSEVLISVNGEPCAKHIGFIEHVEVLLTIHFKPRGNLEIILTSPMKTDSHLLKPRINDREASMFYQWSFTSIHFWGESPKGIWELKIRNSGKHQAHKEGQLHSYQVIFHGTSPK